MIGAGGAAAAAILACRRMRAARIVVANRTPARARALARRFSRFATEWRRADSTRSSIASLLADAALVLNATSMGLITRAFAPLDYAATSPGCFFYDTVYASEATAFLRGAITLGRPHADGAGMLMNQGELAFALFNRVAPPPGLMRRALLERLGRA